MSERYTYNSPLLHERIARRTALAGRGLGASHRDRSALELLELQEALRIEHLSL